MIEGASIIFYLRTSITNIRRHVHKSLLNLILCILIIVLLNVYVENIDSTKGQLASLPESIQVTAVVSNLNGSQNTGLKIKDKAIQFLKNSVHTKDLVYTVQLRMGFGEFGMEDFEGNLNYFGAGVNDIKGVAGLKADEIVLCEEKTLDFLKSTRKECIVDTFVMEQMNMKLGDKVPLTSFYYRYGDYHEIYIEPLDTSIYEIVGSMDMKEYLGSTVQPDIIVPAESVRQAFQHRGDIVFTADACSFAVKDPFQLNEFKEEMHRGGLLSVVKDADYQYDGNALTVSDETFIRSAENLEESLALLKAVFPLLLVIIAFIGYITAYLFIQNRSMEYAIMRSLGIGRAGGFLTMFMETLIVEVAGCVFGGILCVLWMGMGIKILSAVAGSFLVFYVLGSAAALLSMNSLSVMKVLSKNDN